MEIKVTSTAFSNGETIPKKYTGEGQDISPPIFWSDIPEGTKELVLICDDPDAPTEEPWVHWVIYKIPADTEGLPEGLPNTPRLKKPSGAFQGKNSFNSGHTIGYRGPMPPPGHGVHHYYFTLYALKVKLSTEVGLPKSAVMQDMHDYITGKGQLMGTYQR
ncbi:MAG: YbhB/YbcL family Raf kinase inhibitor-like protein [Pirellulales bacterium]|nr:YbhB/YbcL family Raf kinase inhibitor-like protein [Pirellulales bacterium]